MALIASLAAECILSGAQEEDETYVIAYAQIQQPHLLTGQLEFGLPVEFSEHPFYLYLLYQTQFPSQLQWVLCVTGETDEVWRELAEERAWKSFSLDGFTCFVSTASLLHKDNPGISKILAHTKGIPVVAASAALLSDWNGTLKFLYEHEDARNALFGALIPNINENQDDYTSYLRWCIEELTSIDSFFCEIANLNERDVLRATLQVVPGTRLDRVFQKGKESELPIFDFVPKTASKLLIGRLDAPTVNSYMNFVYDGTQEIKDETFVRVRSGLNGLDYGVFDLWDGSWATWTSQNSEDRMLLIGGRFVSSDLSDLFDVLANVPLEGTGFSLKLDDNNSVLGFTRIRSLELLNQDSSESTPALLPKPLYLAVSNGCLAIGENENQVIDLIFKLNTRRPIADSANALISKVTSHSVGYYENGDLIDSVQLNGGRAVFRQTGSVEVFGQIFRWMFNILDH